MKKVIITGGNGMIGGLILENCLKRDDVSSVTSIVRRSIRMKHAKLTEIIHQDFLNFSSIENHFKNMDACFYCIGVYTGQVPKKEFETITVDYTKAFAETLKHNSPAVVFCFLSGEGADKKETSRILFARTKGIAENILIRLQFKSTFIFRPGYIYPVTPRKEPNAAYKIMRVLYKTIFSKVAPAIGVASSQLANAMTDAGLSPAATREREKIYEHRDIREYHIN